VLSLILWLRNAAYHSNVSAALITGEREILKRIHDEMLPGNFPPSHFQDWDSTLYPSLSSVMVCHIHKHKQHRPLLSTAMDRLPHIQTVGRAMLSHASTWQWFTCNSWSLWTDCGRSNCLAKLQQPTRLSLQRRLCDDAFAPLARQVCWHVRSKPHTQTVGRAMLSHVSTWQRFTCHYCFAKLQLPTRLSLTRNGSLKWSVGNWIPSHAIRLEPMT
jgi:hypothetical protein